MGSLKSFLFSIGESIASKFVKGNLKWFIATLTFLNSKRLNSAVLTGITFFGLTSVRTLSKKQRFTTKPFLLFH